MKSRKKSLKIVNDISNHSIHDTFSQHNNYTICRNHTVVYDDYWKFAQERQSVFYKKILGLPQPWSDDDIINKFKFTNAYRASDRVSQYLIRNIIYSNTSFSPEDTIFRIILFKMFNKIQTWKYLENELGEISLKSYSFDEYDKLLTKMIAEHNKIYSAAYIMPSGKTSFGNNLKHKNNLRLLELMFSTQISIKIARAASLQELFKVLLSYPTLGKFLAFQYAIDLNYSELCDFDEMSFVVAGPGAIRGIQKCFPDCDKNSADEVIKKVSANQESEFKRRGIEFLSLNGRRLQLIDCQNLFCEIDKYTRVAYPGVFDMAGVRIKQKYHQTYPDKIEYFYPPKWGINTNFTQYPKRKYGILL